MEDARQACDSVKGPYTDVLDVLRRDRARLDQTIAHLEELDQTIAHLAELDRMRSTSPVTTYVAVPAPPDRKALPASTTHPSQGQQREVSATSADDDARVLLAVKSGAAQLDQVVARTKLPVPRVKRARQRLEANGRLVVKGWARGARWSLPATKEAP